MPTMPTPHVLIIGAGVVGVTLAQALKKRHIPFTIFDRDAHARARGQGWGITVHWALPSLEACTTPELLSRLYHEAQVDPEQGRIDAGNFLFLNAKNGRVAFRIPPNKRVRVKREKFRRVMAEDLEVQWGKGLETISMREGGVVVAHFQDGTTASGTILVGAEGSNSRTRQLLCPDHHALTPLPVRLIGCAIRMSREQAAPLRALDPLLFQGMHPDTGDFFWFSVIDTPLTNDDAGEYFTVQVLISWLVKDPSRDVVPTDNADRIREMKRRASAFADPMNATVMSIPDDAQVIEIKLADWPCLPWDNRGGMATLIGDAAHAMTMYRGEAANHGLMDAANLAVSLGEVCAGKVGLAEAVDAYEREMRERTVPAVLLSRQACLDAHDWEKLKGGGSAVLARRAVRVVQEEGRGEPAVSL